MAAQAEAQESKQTLRPTLVIGLGGTGHRIAVRLKSLVWQSWQPEQIEQWVRFLVFDTAQEDLTAPGANGRTTVMEPGSEFFEIGQTPVANIKRNLAQQSAIQERLGGVMASLPPTVLRNGAKQLRPLGLLAFLWRYAEVEERLRDAIWSLSGRQHNERREGINVFILNSLVGGTGSSTFLDVAHLVRDLFDELGSLADFCYITGVGLLPRAFHGIKGPNLAPNAVASLKELNHCMVRGGFKARYPNGRVITTAQPPFNIYYLVDGVDERGQTWNGQGDVCQLAAEAIFLQMGSQVGQKHENDFDNLDDVLVRQTEAGDGTFYASFGLASVIFSGQAVARACAARLARRVIETGLLAPPELAGPDGEDALNQRLEELWDAAGLEPARLAERLACDEQGLPLSVELPVPGWVSRLNQQAIPAELIRYVRSYEQARLGTDFRRWLGQNEEQLAGQAAALLASFLARLAGQVSLPAAEAWLDRLLGRLETTAGLLSSRQAEREGQQLALSQELSHLELVFLQAGESYFFGRGRRIAQAQHAYMTTAQNLFEIRWEQQVTAAGLKVFNHLARQVQDGLAACRAATGRLKAAARTLARQAGAGPHQPELAGVTSLSLASPSLVEALFEQHALPPADIIAGLFNSETSPLDWREMPPAEIEARLLAACWPAFAGIAAMGVEQVIARQRAETLPENHYVWLMSQATPSWNLDRTRLPDGGAGLQRLEVLGVPDEAGSVYRRHARALVSTGDPSRITAFVAHVGAAHTAIQQWDGYQALYEQARGRTPLHVLPEFQADQERARQTFALGSLFGFITNQGAYFYYIPADRLARQVKLAQGLANSLEVFSGKEALVQETRERVEQVVAGRGVEATLRALGQYYDSGNGRYPADELVLELKRLVRAYADELRQIHQFAPGPAWPAADGTDPAGGQEESGHD